MDDSFFVHHPEGFESTAFTTGPWDPRAQHGGPPSALMARELERAGAELGCPFLARLTVSILKPVPISLLRVESSVDKAGRSVARLSASLFAGDVLLASARALMMRRRSVAVDLVAEPAASVGPDASDAFEFPFFRTDVGYHTAIELRLARGTFGKTPTFMWMRSRVSLVEGEEISPAQRVVVAADSGNGVSPIVDWRQTTFINPDLSVHLFRPLHGEWVGLDARTSIDPESGTGTAHSHIHDEKGPVGYGLQSLLIDPV